MTAPLMLPNVAVCVCPHAVRRRGWGGQQNHETGGRDAETAKPSYHGRGSTNTTTTTNYTLSLFYRLQSMKTNVNVSFRGGGLP
jgi:hypothetical protein